MYGNEQMRQEAAYALEKMFADARAEGVDLIAVSGYRSYEYQREVYEGNVEEHGEDYAQTFSAKPGESEHQTGLTMDISSPSLGQGEHLTEKFASTDEGIWLENNAADYGFILRYPEGKDYITGYIYEPWHYRYIGNENTANYLMHNFDTILTYEKYLEVAKRKHGDGSRASISSGNNQH